MAYTKLVLTILCGNDKYEVYAASESASPQRIIHYKLQETKENGVATHKWAIINHNFPIPQDLQYQIASNLIWYFSEL